jgi:hypothetical protein
MIFLVTMWLTVLVPKAWAVTAAQFVMPKELVEAATHTGCEQVHDFFDRVGAVDPYVYGVASGETTDSAAYWCGRELEGKRTFQLNLWSRKQNESKVLGCANVIHVDYYPRGLRLVRLRAVSLVNFREVGTNQSAPKGVTISSIRAIITSYDGLQSTFICYGGKWLVKEVD